MGSNQEAFTASAGASLTVCCAEKQAGFVSFGTTDSFLTAAHLVWRCQQVSPEP